MNVYKEDPQVALATWEKIAEEIPSGVSALDVGQILTVIGPCPTEITDGLKEDIAIKFKQNINVFWESHNVSEKLQTVKNYKCSDSDTVWYPPLSPQGVLTATKARHLECLKEELRPRIEKLKKENYELEKILKEKCKLIHQQRDEMNSCDFVL